MNNQPSTSRQNVFDDDIFEDSNILAHFDNSSFGEKNSRFTENNLNDSNNKSGLNVSALCCDEEFNGYDKLTGQTWVYPTNYPVRDYQFNIIQSAIFKNTLVSLPTGLGKTFIAAVIMYNFYRWYPLGKIVFTAPTRPLVAQQIDACYNIVAIPPKDTVEMTGHMQVATRKTHWQTKRVFFATPQVIYNDVKSGICPADQIRCLVIDEAHRARGNYAYCQIVGTLTDMGCKTYRVLALSATPGSKVEDVIQVVRNLHIAHLELRTENCIDVAPYSHVRKINTVVIQLGPEISQLRHHYIEILDEYARRLKQLNILPQNLGNLSKGRIVMLYKEFQNKDPSSRLPQHNYIMKDFNHLIGLFHGLELLVKHGSRVFLNFFDDHPEKTWIQSDDRLTALLERLRDDLGVNPMSLDRSMLPDGTMPKMPENLSFGHPKFYKLKEIMLEHFTKAKLERRDTRAIVFCEYRESVSLVHCLLLQCRPLITAQMFVGQGASGKDGKTAVSQKQQLRVMRNFREGVCNTLVATCVAEEGLDVGSVDMIICFDISNNSPVRLVQRCGRTGRERSGQVHILVTEGREHQTLQECMRQRDGLNKKIQASREVKTTLYKNNPRMVPHGITPCCQKMYITVKKQPVKDDRKKNQKDLRSMLQGRQSSSSSNTLNSAGVQTEMISEDEFNAIYPNGYSVDNFLEKATEYWAKSKKTIKELSKMEKTTRDLSKWLEWQRSLQKTVHVGHSKDSEILTSLLQYSDAKRLELPPSTQNPCFNTQDLATQNIMLTPQKVRTMTSSLTPASPKIKQIKKKLKNAIVKSPGKKDGDIRALFSTGTKSTKNYTKLINDLGIQNDSSITTTLKNLLVDLKLNSDSDVVKTCYICANICDCKLISRLKQERSRSSRLITFLKEPYMPNLDLIDDMDAECVLKCFKKDVSVIDTANNDNKEDYLELDRNISKNFELEFDFDSPVESIVQDKSNDDIKDNSKRENFNIGDIDDIFAESSPEEATTKHTENIDKNASNPKEALGFFGLDSIDDIFADSDDSINNNVAKTPKKKDSPIVTGPREPAVDEASKMFKFKTQQSNTCKVSPSILSGNLRIEPTSPILCSQVRKFKLSTKKREMHTSTPTTNVKRCLIPESIKDKTKTEANPSKNIAENNKDDSKIQTSHNDATNKSMFTITQLVNMINKTNDKSTISKDDKIESRPECTSPIFLTQDDKRKMNKNCSKNKTNAGKKAESLIILESDSESDNETQCYFVGDKLKGNERLELKTPEKKTNANEPSTSISISSNKRKEIEDDTIKSPFFKRQKTEDSSKRISLQQKVLAALSSNKMSFNFKSDKDESKADKFSNVSYMLTQNGRSQKENVSPIFDKGWSSQKKEFINESKDEYVRKNNLEMLQMFRRDSKVASPKTKFESLLSPKVNGEINKRKLTFDDSDDDFIDSNDKRSQKAVNNGFKKHLTLNHKVRKKRKPRNDLLDLEADLSDDQSDSGDELSDDSVGSIADFICDENVTHPEDMQAHYIQSVKSPRKGMFKIPALPKKCEPDVFSQFVEEDHYEMDSFCVDSHIGLTQAHDMTDLEVAELVLEERRSKKKRQRTDSAEKEDSPLVRKKKVARIQSDSDDSS